MQHSFQFVLGHNTKDTSAWREDAMTAYTRMFADRPDMPHPSEVGSLIFMCKLQNPYRSIVLIYMIHIGLYTSVNPPTNVCTTIRIR